VAPQLIDIKQYFLNPRLTSEKGGFLEKIPVKSTEKVLKTEGKI
jgi:hypothetical protein